MARLKSSGERFCQWTSVKGTKNAVMVKDVASAPRNPNQNAARTIGKK